MKLRIPKYLSYSAVTKFMGDRDEYFLRYIAEHRTPRSPQGKPASVGSAFDARVKSVLYEHVYGENYKPEQFSYEALFEKQVEAHGRDFAGPAGDYVYDCYKTSGMLDRFIEIIDKAVEPPQFEFRVEKTVGGVPLLGLPDGHVKLPNDLNFILDWKVNGFCSKSSLSPNKGFLKCLDGFVAKKQSRSHDTSHGDCISMMLNGIEINGQFAEDYSEQWASQTSGYAWCLEEPVGSENWVMAIHQCVCKPLPSGDYPVLRFSEYRSRVRKPFQDMLLRKYQRCWKAVSTGHIFDELSREQSDERCEMLNNTAARMAHDVNSADGDGEWFNDVVRPNWW